MSRTTVSVPEDMSQNIEKELSYGDSKSGWVREAVELRWAVDPLLDDRFGDHEPEARREFVKEAVQEKLDREEGE